MIPFEKIFLEVSDGFSPIEDILIRHIDIAGNAAISAFRDSIFEEYKAKGFRTEEQTLATLDKKGIWTKDEEKKLEQKKKEVEGLKKALPKITMPKEKKNLEKTIESSSSLVAEQSKKRSNFIGLTAESAADNLCYDFQVCVSCCDKERKQIMSWEEFEQLEEEDSLKYHRLFAEHHKVFSNKNIRNVAVQPFLLNIFYLIPKESAHLLFNRPLHLFTYNQSSLANTARRVRDIRDNMSGVPDEKFNDVDELFKYAEGGKQEKPENQADASKIIAKNKGKPVSLINNPDSV